METVTAPRVAAPARLVLHGSDGYRAPATRIEALPGPRRLPLLGNTHQFDPAAMHRNFERWVEEFGSMFRMSIGSTTYVAIADPGLVGEVFRHRPASFSRGDRLSTAIEELLPRGVFTAEGDDWRRQRRLVMRALTPEAIRGFFPIVRTVTERLLAKWQAAAADGQVLDVTRDLKRYSVDVATWLTMDVDVNTLEHPENPLQEDIEFWFDAVGRRFRSPLPYWRWVKLPIDRRVDEVTARLHETIAGLIAEVRGRLDADPERRRRPRNIVETLVAVRDEPGSGFSDDDVMGNVATMLFAGEDTAANTMAWLLHLLATNPDACRRARAEVDALAGPRHGLDDFADLSRLPYLEAAAIESMRIRPVAPLGDFNALVDADLAGLQVSRGQRLMLVLRPSGLDAGRFPDPQRFEPARWLGAQGERADDPRRVIFPFGGGPRYCPGRFLAMVEIKMVTAAVLHRFELRSADPSPPRERLTFTMGPDRVPLRLIVR